MILRSARAARDRRVSLSIVWQRSLWYPSTKSAGHRGHEIRFDFLTTQSADNILGDSSQMLTVSKSTVMTTAEEIQVSVFGLGKGRFDLLIRERHVHLLQLLMLDGSGATGSADESSMCSCFECIVESLGHSVPHDPDLFRHSEYCRCYLQLPAELALLAALTSDLQSQMVIDEAHDETGDSH